MAVAVRHVGLLVALAVGLKRQLVNRQLSLRRQWVLGNVGVANVAVELPVPRHWAPGERRVCLLGLVVVLAWLVASCLRTNAVGAVGTLERHAVGVGRDDVRPWPSDASDHLSHFYQRISHNIAANCNVAAVHLRAARLLDDADMFIAWRPLGHVRLVAAPNNGIYKARAHRSQLGVSIDNHGSADGAGLANAEDAHHMVNQRLIFILAVHIRSKILEEVGCQVGIIHITVRDVGEFDCIGRERIPDEDGRVEAGAEPHIVGQQKVARHVELACAIDVEIVNRRRGPALDAREGARDAINELVVD